jgi:hypothetical protein
MGLVWGGQSRGSVPLGWGVTDEVLGSFVHIPRSWVDATNEFAVGPGLGASA